MNMNMFVGTDEAADAGFKLKSYNKLFPQLPSVAFVLFIWSAVKIAFL